MGSARISVAEDNIVQEVWHNALGVHQLPDGLEYGFEVVLLGLSPDDDVEGFVHVLATS